MRDRLKETNHWKDLLEVIDEELTDDIGYLNTISSDDHHGINSSNAFIWGNYLLKISVLYSSGADIKNIRTIFPEFISFFEKSWTKENGYVDLIWAVSLGIMLDISSDVMQKLQELVKRENYRDYLLDFMFNSIDSEWEIISDDFNAHIPYKELHGIINAHDSTNVTKLLKEYLDKKWYKGHDEEGWYNSHKHTDYAGYWSFESGAVAKILKLNDTGWENQKYYPYDMVHYSDKK